jgi:uncharacterized membrane protein YfcA
MRDVARILAALGASVAPIGLTVYAMGTAYREPRDADIRTGIILMVVGLVALVVGLLWLRFSPDEERA